VAVNERDERVLKELESVESLEEAQVIARREGAVVALLNTDDVRDATTECVISSHRRGPEKMRLL
jgi:hypothetical protein